MLDRRIRLRYDSDHCIQAFHSMEIDRSLEVYNRLMMLTSIYMWNKNMSKNSKLKRIVEELTRKYNKYTHTFLMLYWIALAICSFVR